MADDWFDQNVPSADSGDWFEQNHPAAHPGMPAAPKTNVESSLTDKALGFLGTTGADVGQGILQGSYKSPINLPGLLASRALGLKTPNTEAQNTAQRVGQGIEQTGEMIASGGPLRSAATSLASKFPFLGRMSGPVARILAESANTGGSAAFHGQPIGTSAATGAAGGAFGELASAGASKLMEKALGITGKAKQYGQTPGKALLENTSALTPTGIARQSQTASLGLTGQMEAGVNATGGTLSTAPAHQVLDNALQSAPRNATTYKDKLESLRKLLTLDASGRQDFSPDEILELKRGIKTEISAWDVGSKKATSGVVRRLYGSLDKQLDAAVPGNAELNQRISSLIAGSKAAKTTAMGGQRGFISQIAAKGILPSIGFGVGYEHGGTGEGAALGAAAFALQTPAGRIAVSRLMNAGFPENIARAIVAGQGQK